MTSGAAGDHPDRRSGARAFAHGSGIAAFIGFAPYFAFGAVQFAAVLAVDTAEARAEVARDAVRQRQGVEPDVEFAASFHAAGFLNLGDGTGNITSDGDHDTA